MGRITVDLYQVLKDRGEEGLILYGRREAPKGIPAVRIHSNLAMGFHVVKTFFEGSHGFGSKKTTRKIIEKIKEYDPDIIHLHNIHGFYLNVEELFSYLKVANKAVVWTLHDCWSFTGHCAYFDYAGCEKWQTGCYACEQHRDSYPYAIFKDNSVENYNKKKAIFTGVQNLTIVTPSHWLKNLVKGSFLSEYAVEVIPNGIDLEKFKPTTDNYAIQFRKDKYTILGVANVWEKRKGLSFFTQLSKQLDDSYQIILVGLSKKQKKELPASIIGITRTNQVSELAELYTLANVYVNTTLEDNFPTTNLEALACGTPVITFDTGGSKESLNADCGIVVKKGDIPELKKAIETLRRRPFSQEACLAQSRQFEKKKRFEQYIELYHKILDKS